LSTFLPDRNLKAPACDCAFFLYRLLSVVQFKKRGRRRGLGDDRQPTRAGPGPPRILPSPLR
jgi:hypothetical protein